MENAKKSFFFFVPNSELFFRLEAKEKWWWLQTNKQTAIFLTNLFCPFHSMVDLNKGSWYLISYEWIVKVLLNCLFLKILFCSRFSRLFSSLQIFIFLFEFVKLVSILPCSLFPTVWINLWLMCAWGKTVSLRFSYLPLSITLSFQLDLELGIMLLRPWNFLFKSREGGGGEVFVHLSCRRTSPELILL